MNTEITAEQLDPGIRATVRWLREHGFVTTDSGDGVRKRASIAAGFALPFPHVFMTTSPAMMVADAQRLLALLDHYGLRDVGRIEATYSPIDGVAVLALYDVDDAALAAKEQG